MTRRWLFFFGLAAALGAQKIPDAIPAPGELALPLYVTERSGVAREHAVVVGGVPFPPGFLHDERRLQVLDAKGRPVPTQVSVLTRWWRPPRDHSVRWALLRFLGSVPARGRATYTLVDRPAQKERRAGPKVRVEEGDKVIRVDTGAARFVLPRRGRRLFLSARAGGRELLGEEGIELFLTGGGWPEVGMTRGARYRGRHEGLVEERGPVRAVIRFRGVFRGEGPGTFRGPLYGYTVRLYFHAGSPRVRAVLTLENGRLDRDLYVWPVEDLSLLIQVRPGPRPQVSVLGGRGPVTVDLARRRYVALYQDSSGGPQWKVLRPRGYTDWLARPCRKKTPKGEVYEVRGVRFSGYVLTADGEVLERGPIARGVLALSGEAGGVAVAYRNFRARYPAALAALPGAVRVGLWPGEFADVLFLEPGQRFTRELLLDFHAGPIAPASISELHALLDRRLLCRAPPRWYRLSGGWDAGVAELPPPRSFGRQNLLGLDKDRLDGIDVGWDWYGWIVAWNQGGAHWNQSTCFLPWLLWEDNLAFDVAEARALWAADVTPLHFGEPDLSRFWPVLRGYKWRDRRMRKHTFPGYYRRAVWGNPDDGHLGMFMWFEYYYLTGDRRVLASCLALGVRARAYAWCHNHDDSSPPFGARPFPWCRKKDPKDPYFRLHNRYQGWPLYNLALYYQLTGRAELLQEAATVAAGLRNTARSSPIGFLTTNFAKPGDRNTVYTTSLATGDPPTDTGSMVYGNFQQGIVATGLVQYYRESLDEDALDTAVGIADCYVHHCLLRDRSGRPVGWTYVFGDYWGPYRLEELDPRWKPNWLNQNFRLLQALGWIYLLTGREDYREVLRVPLEGRHLGPVLSMRVIAGLQAVHHPHADRTPPAPVKDLRVEVVGKGRVRLTWTAPGDDGMKGRARRYQVKYSRSPIVERTRGWPDRTPPLPRTWKEWEAKAQAFLRKQRAFWSARNVRGEPTPGPAGTEEQFEIAGLAPGVWYFALKTWDDGPNMSALSNVVRVEVP